MFLWFRPLRPMRDRGSSWWPSLLRERSRRGRLAATPSSASAMLLGLLAPTTTDHSRVPLPERKSSVAWGSATGMVLSSEALSVISVARAAVESRRPPSPPAPIVSKKRARKSASGLGLVALSSSYWSCQRRRSPSPGLGPSLPVRGSSAPSLSRRRPSLVDQGSSCSCRRRSGKSCSSSSRCRSRGWPSGYDTSLLAARTRR
mmetsp:Transcript_6987/g.12531  ORF Transcript_6987/g.12531 Transcript_6987/m.12531 type:complete len:203 (+) Transcript_6987:200-808(+)